MSQTSEASTIKPKSRKEKPKADEEKPKTRGVKCDYAKFMEDDFIELFLGAKVVWKRASGEGILFDHLQDFARGIGDKLCHKVGRNYSSMLTEGLSILSLLVTCGIVI